MLNAN